VRTASARNPQSTIREKMMGNSTTPQPGNSQGGAPSTARQQASTADAADFVLVDSEQGLDIGDDLFSIGKCGVPTACRITSPARPARAARARTTRPTTGSTGV
jgi:hypothetical protein